MCHAGYTLLVFVWTTHKLGIRYTVYLAEGVTLGKCEDIIMMLWAYRALLAA